MGWVLLMFFIDGVFFLTAEETGNVKAHRSRRMLVGVVEDVVRASLGFLLLMVVEGGGFR